MEYLRKWNTLKTERQKLQDAYLLFGVVIVIISGLITFLNVKLGYGLVMIGLALLAAYVVNGIGWHLLSSMILSKISSKPKKK